MKRNMSVTLRTRVSGHIEVRKLILDTSQALRDLLNLLVSPPIKAGEFRNGDWRPLSPTTSELSSTSSLLGLSIENEPETICISVYEQTRERFSAEDWKPEELGPIASIEVCGPRTGLSMALVAAAAIAIARECGGSIADESNLYTTATDCLAEQFLESTKVTATFSGYRDAANHFKNQNAHS
jgi:hypothetical protein